MTPETKRRNDVMRALADPQDALALVAVLRGSFFGISDRELFAFKQSGGWFTIFTSRRSVRLEADQNPGGVRLQADPDPGGVRLQPDSQSRVPSALDTLHQYAKGPSAYSVGFKPATCGTRRSPLRTSVR